MLVQFARHLRILASMQIGRMAAHPPDCSVNLTASRLQSKTYLNRQGCAHIEALHSSSRRHISSSLHASARGSVVTAYTPSAAGASEWDDILDSTSDKGTRAQRTGSKGPHGITKRAQNPSQSAGGGLGRANDWDLGSDRRASEQGRMRGRDSGWRGGGDSRGGRGGRASFSGRGNSNTPGAGRSDREAWGGDSRGERGGGSSFPGRGSRDGNGASTSGREAWGKSSTAPSGDGWRPSSRGRASPGRGSLQRDSARGGGAYTHWGDRAGQYEQPKRPPWEVSAVPKAPQLADKLQGEALYGVNPVLGALQAKRRECHTLYVQESQDQKKRKSGVPQAVAAMKAAGGAIEYISKHELNLVANNRPHQGLVLDCSALAWEPLDQFPPADEAAAASVRLPVWLALDEIEDPQNMGAALRAAYFLGAAGVLTCARNSAPLSPAVSKASAGALEFMPVRACASMPRTLMQAAGQGWHVIGAGNEADARSCRSFKPESPTILVVGNEGRGLRPVVRRACRDVLRIDSAAVEGKPFSPVGVESLNVSMAAGILLHQLLLHPE